VEIVGAQDLSEKEFEGLAIARPYLDLLGFVAPDFQAFIWGAKGSGKSTFALGLAISLLDFAKMEGGRVLYVSSEEGPGRTLSNRAGRLSAHHDNDLLMSDFSSVEALREAVLENDVEFVVVDSITVVSPRTNEARDLFEWLKRRGVGVALVAHAKKGGEEHKGNSSLAHNCDVVVRCFHEWNEAGQALGHYAETTKNRFKPLETIRIPMEGSAMARPNPDCTSPQSAQCKAIFASLDEDGEKRVSNGSGDPSTGSSGSSDSSSSSSTGGNGGDGGSAAGGRSARQYDDTASKVLEQLSAAIK
jgi:KaiC/GvpD/RAD55 family RecA-like ATPase